MEITKHFHHLILLGPLFFSSCWLNIPAFRFGVYPQVRAISHWNFTILWVCFFLQYWKFWLRVYLEVPHAQKKSFKANGLLAEIASCLGILFNFEFMHLFWVFRRKFFSTFSDVWPNWKCWSNQNYFRFN